MRTAILVALLGLGFVTGCATNADRTEQLGKVAKEWSRTIRASQVLPIYPLSNAVNVGTMMVVERPVEDEVDNWDTEGFLPLSQELGVLKLSTAGDLKPEAAAFPSFSTSLDRSAGLEAAIPVSGIPVAFGLIGSSKANATVALKDATTVGVAIDSVQVPLEAWLKENEREKNLLSYYQPKYGRDRDGYYRLKYNYLRVITRLYLIKSIDVTVSDASGLAADLSVGVSKNIQLVAPTTQSAELTKSLLDAVNPGIARDTSELGKKPEKAPAEKTPKDKTDKTKQPVAGDKPPEAGAGEAPPANAEKPEGDPKAPAPAAVDVATKADKFAGGRLKFVSVSNLSVSLNEEFDSPIVVGYIAIDFPIGYDGKVITSSPVYTNIRSRTGGGIRLQNQVEDWLRDDPLAKTKLKNWIEQGKNTAYLMENGLPTDHAGLAKALREQSWPSFGKYRDVNRRVVNEIIDRPPGLEFRPGTPSFVPQTADRQPTPQPATVPSR